MNKKCNDEKKSKERLSFLLAEKVDGSMKLTPLVVGKILKPCCQKNYKFLTVSYNASQMVWITRSIWEKESQCLDKFGQTEK